jgi:uncharacterized protein (DUF885 family)
VEVRLRSFRPLTIVLASVLAAAATVGLGAAPAPSPPAAVVAAPAPGLDAPAGPAAAAPGLPAAPASPTPRAAAPAVPAAGSPTRIVREAGAAYTAYLEQHDIGLRIKQGLPLEEMPEVSLAAARRDAAFGRALLARLGTVGEAELSDEDAISLGVLRFAAEGLAAAESARRFEAPVTPYASPLKYVHQALAMQSLATAADRERTLRLLDRYAAWIADTEALLREQAAHGFVLPRPELPLVAPQLRNAADVAGGPLRLDPSRLAAVAEPERSAFAVSYGERLRARVQPALASLLGYVEGDYAKAAPAGVGLGQYPGGLEHYRFLVHLHTTLDLTPEAIHAIGLAMGQQLDRDLDAVRSKVAFNGSLAEFRRYLRTDRRFIPRSAGEIGERLLAAQKRLEPLLPRWFSAVPKAPYGVEQLAPELAGAMTFGLYDSPNPARPRGIYYYNGSRLEERSLLMAAPLIYHELVPGHHYQIALQQENAALPLFRRFSFPTAFVEGWGEYASDLAGEMGLYADPYDRAGRIMMASFLAARLVVDTGMNALGWPRERARAYLAEHTLQSEAEIATETLRYSCDIPGQALAYALGARALHDLRARAERELGRAFDPRRFHQAVLGGGAMPLGVLSTHVDRFIAAEKRGQGR